MENLKRVSETTTSPVTLESIEQRALLTEALIFLKREVFAKEREVKLLKENIATFTSVDFNTDISSKAENQNKIVNQIDVAQLAETEAELIDIISRIEVLEMELDKLVLDPSEEVEVSPENKLNEWLDLQIQIVENEMLRDELNGENNVATENDSVIELKQQAAETEPSNLDSKLDALTELVFTLRSENIKSGEARNTYFEAAKKLLEKWQKEEEKV